MARQSRADALAAAQILNALSDAAYGWTLVAQAATEAGDKMLANAAWKQVRNLANEGTPDVHDSRTVKASSTDR